jgi:hypothetical protein
VVNMLPIDGRISVATSNVRSMQVEYRFVCETCV